MEFTGVHRPSFQGRGVTTKGVPSGWGVLHKMIIQLFHGRHTVQTMLAALPLWVATCYAEGLEWNRKDVERFSPVQSAILEPISCMNLRPIGAHEPRVSTATGITVKPLAANAS